MRAGYCNTSWPHCAASERNRAGSHPNGQLGIVGVGHVGSLVEEYGRLLGFRVVCCDPPRMRLTPGLGFLTLDELLSLSDIVTLHVPFTTEGPDKTAGMASGEFFARMRPGSAFINCSRGPVMQDGPHARRALREGTYVRTPRIDTWNHEPGNRPRTVGEELFCATPHIAGYSVHVARPPERPPSRSGR
ncbi:MAG: NAD(P)-dependent oxidoreductase [Alistipes indistinctus]